MSEKTLYVPIMTEVLAHLDATTVAWHSIDPEDILQATAELCEKMRLKAVSEQHLDSDSGAIWVSEQHGRHVVTPGYLSPDTSVYHNWQMYVPAVTAGTTVFIAHVQYGPEDVAIGLGLRDESAIEALRSVYPAAVGAAIEVTTCTMGAGLASL